MAERFELLPDGSGQFVDEQPGPYSFSPPTMKVVKRVEAKTVSAMREALLKEQAASPAPPALPANSLPVEG